MKHLVLGSSGQIGAYLIKYLQNKGEEVIEFDIIESKNEDLRIYNNPLLEASVNQCDMIHFLAFDVGGAKYLEKHQDTYQFINNNMEIMVNTFKLIKKYNKPVFFASSQMSELGYSSYGQLKSLGEKMTKDLGGIITRFWNVYGYETNEEKSHVITDFIKMARYDGVIKMRTDGTESRQFLHADDCSECLFTLSKNYKNLDKSKSYHITSFKWTSIVEIAKIIQNISKCDIISSNKKDNTQKNSMNEASKDILDIWKPNITLIEGITNLYNRY